MNDFLSDLFQAAGKRSDARLADYDDEDLVNFFDSPVADCKASLMAMASSLLDCLDDADASRECAVRTGLSAKSADKVVQYVVKNRGELHDVRTMRYSLDDGILANMEYSVRTVFYSKANEFKDQKTYAVVDFDIEKDGSVDKLRLNCSKENINKIRSKLDLLDTSIRKIFEQN